MIIEARSVQKFYGNFEALKEVDISIDKGQIVGIIGPNGSGKTTLLSSLLGLIHASGQIAVLGKDPRKERDALMQDICFIADVAILPKWMTVSQALTLVEGLHSRFDRKKAEKILEGGKLSPKMKVSEMSKGMVVQLHLALVMAIDSKLLVLDEPTLGLDPIWRTQFYKYLREDYFNAERSIIITTHQVEEVEDILTHLVFVKDGFLPLKMSVPDFHKRFIEVAVSDGQLEAAKRLGPIYERLVQGHVHAVFDGKTPAELASLGATRPARVVDVFVGLMQEGAKL